MIKKKIVIKTIDEAHNFVNIATNVCVDIDLSAADRRYVVDAKSLLGVCEICTVGTEQPLILTIHDNLENKKVYDKLFASFEYKET